MSAFEFIVGLLLILITGLIFWDINSRFCSSYKTAQQITGPFRWPVIGILPDFLTLTPETIIQWLTDRIKRYNGFFAVWQWGILCLHVVRAEDIQVILSSRKHTKKSFMYEFLRPFLKRGLLTSHGPKWAERRRILTPAFHFNMLQRYMPIFLEHCDDFVEKISEENGNETDLFESVSRFSLNTICETAMGLQLQNSIEESDNYRKNLYDFGRMFSHRLVNPIYFWDFIYKLFGHKSRVEKHLAPLHEYSATIITKRQSEFIRREKSDTTDENIYSSKTKYAMLDTLLVAEHEGQIDAAGIHEEVDTFTFEGHDTTSAGITFTLLLLANHPEVQDRVYNEINEMLDGTATHDLTVNNISSLEYLDRVVKESLRLYPPVFSISRELSEEVVINNVKVPPKTTIFLHIYHLHRDPKYFPDPEKFDPDRFLPENCEGRHSYAYIPFSAGPRNCIGQKFATLELKSIVVKTLLKFRLKAVTKMEELELLVDLVIRNKHPVRVRFVPRNN